MTARGFFRCRSNGCGHITPFRGGPRGIVEHNRRRHDGHAKYEQVDTQPGHAILRHRYSDAWEEVNLVGADIAVVPAMFNWTLLISTPGQPDFIHGEWATRRTAEETRYRLLRIGRAAQ